MKLIAFMLLVGFLKVSAHGYGQKVSLSFKGVPLKTIFKEIRQQTGYDFFYEDAQLNLDASVNVQLKDATLDELFKELKMKYSVAGNTIIIKRRIDAFGDSSMDELKPPIDVKGRVVNEKGDAAAGVTVSIKGTKRATATNANGEFSFIGLDPASILIISGANIENYEVKVSGRKEFILDVKMKVAEISEVIISTGYQDINKNGATGSFVKIDNNMINRGVSTDILNRIYNLSSGLNYDPKTNNILIRGISTINASMLPLIVIDNFPFEGNINTINPNDVESVTILKDASAAAIWGVKAGNGVIVITTKKGKYGQRLNVQATSSTTFTQRPDLFYKPQMKSADEIDFEKKLFASGYFNVYDDQYPSFNYFPALPKVAEILLAVRGGKLSQSDADRQIMDLASHDTRDDQKKYLYQTGVMQQNAVSFSGGSSVLNYYASVGYDKNKSNRKGSSYDRMNFRLENTFRPLAKLELNAYIVYTHAKATDNDEQLRGIISPYTRLADQDGTAVAVPLNNRLAYVDTAVSGGLLDWHYKPLDELKNNDKTVLESNTRIGAEVKYTFLPGFSAQIMYQYQKSFQNATDYYSVESYYTRDLVNQYYNPATGSIRFPVPVGSILDKRNTVSNNSSARAQINYSHRWRLHDVVAIAGTEIREENTDRDNNREYGYNVSSGLTRAVDYITQFPLSSGATATVPYFDMVGGSLKRYRSLYANASYIYSGKYAFTISGRVDHSNFFGVKTNLRRVPLWSAGLGWDISKESFYHIGFLPYLKFRATYGFNGNTNNSASAYTTISSENGAFSITGAPFAIIRNPPNPDLRWEKVKVINMGIDFESKNRRISGTLEYYTKKGIDLISDISIDPTTGVAKFTGNDAGLKGSGIDLSITSLNVNKRLKWYTTLLLNRNSDKVISYEIEPTTVNQYLNPRSPIVGQPLFKINSYQWGNLDPLNGAPRAYVDNKIVSFDEANKNAKISDLVYSGRLLPLYFGSFRNDFTFQQFSLSFNIVGKFGYYYRKSSVNYSNLYNLWNTHSDFDLRWKKPGDEMITNVPSLPDAPDSRDNIYLASDALIVKGDHIRLQDIRLSYDYKPALSSRLPIQNIRFFVIGNNLGILWRANKNNIDPEYGDLALPPSKEVSVGVNINLK